MEASKSSKGLRVSMALLLACTLAFGGTFSTVPQAYAEPKAVATGEDTGTDTGTGDVGGVEDATEQPAVPEGSVDPVVDEAVVEPLAAPDAEEGIEALAVSPTGDVTVDTVADLIDAVNNAAEDRTITLTAAFQADMAANSSTIGLSNAGGHTIVVEGSDLALAQGGSARFFSVSNPGGGSVTIQNLSLSGAGAGIGTSSDAAGSVILDNVHVSGSTTRQLSVGIGNTTVSNSSFTNSTDGAASVAGSGSGPANLVMTETTIADNTAAFGVAFNMGFNGKINLSNCTLSNNKATSGGYGWPGGAIVANNTQYVDLVFDNCYFFGNEAPPSNTSNNAGGQGGAICLYNCKDSTLTVTDSYFKENKTVANASKVTDGGAIAIFGNNAGSSTTTTIDNCTFEGNIASDDGGAILFQGNSSAVTTTASVTNSTFVDNVGREQAQSSGGGAVQIYYKCNVDFTGCTFYNNTAGNGNGGAIYAFWSNVTNIKDCLFVGNTSKNPTGNQNNVGSFLGTLNKLSGNVGLDAGTTLDPMPTVKSVFGTDAPTLQINGCGTQVGATPAGGSPMYLPTLYIAPALDSSTPSIYADQSGSGGTANDQRQVVRNATSPDAGAVDIGWIKLDPNGGTWDVSAIGDYDTTRMLSHTDSSSKTYVFAATDSGADVTLPGDTMFSTTPDSSALLGWGETPTSKPGDADFHAIGDDVLGCEGAVCGVYYAIWASPQSIDLTVARLFGIDRYETSNKVSTYERVAADEDVVILASGWDYNFADALTASALSGSLGNAPIVLTDNEVLSPGARATISDDLNVSRVIIVGSTDAINQDVEDEVAAIPHVTTVERIGGVDRQETAEMIYDYIGTDHSDTAIIARCCDFPDSLTISPWAAATKSPIFLSDFGLQTLTDGTKAELAAGGYTRIIVLGDENATPQSVYEEARDAAGLTDANMIRIGGIDRYETSAMVAQWVTSTDRPASERLEWTKPAISRGDKHSDSLTGGALQGRDRSIILLTPPDSVSTYSYPLVQAKDGTIVEIRFFGDENAVSLDVTKDFINALTYDSIIWKPDNSVIIPLV